MNDKAFLDTNILIYAIETGGPTAQKAERARELLRNLDVSLSTQVLGEFYNAATHPRRPSPLTHAEAVAWIQIWKRYGISTISVEHVDLALEIRTRFQVGYYDALILAAARIAGCRTVYSEDLNANQDYDGVQVVNPFE